MKLPTQGASVNALAQQRINLGGKEYVLQFSEVPGPAYLVGGQKDASLLKTKDTIVRSSIRF